MTTLKKTYGPAVNHPPKPTELLPHEKEVLPVGKTPLHDAHGVLPEYTRKQYMSIINQDDNLAVKLKALAPFARELGLDPDPAITQAAQNIIIMIPPEISSKYKLIDPVIDI